MDEDGGLTEPCISEDSSFYGDDDQKSDLKKKDNEISDHDLVKLWDFQLRSINAIAFVEKATQGKAIVEELKNPYEGDPAARQLNESVDEFLKRMPVLNHPFVGPWLWIANFFSRGQTFDENHNSSNVPGFIKKGQILLQEYLDKRSQLEREFPNLAAGSITRRLGPDREKLKDNLLQVAKSCEILAGKWLLFPPDEHTPDVWGKVCHAVAENRLGIGAKVAADGDTGTVRVICIYTKDFNNKQDIQRVILELDRSQLLPRDKNKSIYYKCDAYSYLNIMSGNSYGLSASLYASKDFLSDHEKYTTKPLIGTKRKYPV